MEHLRVPKPWIWKLGLESCLWGPSHRLLCYYSHWALPSYAAAFHNVLFLGLTDVPWPPTAFWKNKKWELTLNSALTNVVPAASGGRAPNPAALQYVHDPLLLGVICQGVRSQVTQLHFVVVHLEVLKLHPVTQQLVYSILRYTIMDSNRVDEPTSLTMMAIDTLEPLRIQLSLWGNPYQKGLCATFRFAWCFYPKCLTIETTEKKLQIKGLSQGPSCDNLAVI